jgi:hypothetical protein
LLWTSKLDRLFLLLARDEFKHAIALTAYPVPSVGRRAAWPGGPKRQIIIANHENLTRWRRCD